MSKSICGYIIVFFSLFSLNILGSQCILGEVDNTCTKVKITHKEYKFLKSIFTAAPLCEVQVQEVETGLDWRKMAVSFCPNIDEGREILAYAKYNCSVDFIDRSRSKFYIMTPEECEPILALREKTKSDFMKIKAGISMSEFEKIGFTGRKAGGDVWEYSYPPSFTVSVQVTGEKCSDTVYCTDPKIQKFQKIIKIRDLNLNGKTLD